MPVMMVDLENGSGNNNDLTAAGTPPYPADPEIKEKQPFTWLGAVPYIVADAAGAAMFVAGVVMVFSGQQESYETTKDFVGTALVCVGTLVLASGLLLGCIVSSQGGCDRNLPRLGPE